jgi:S1-C subfamily serine protease
VQRGFKLQPVEVPQGSGSGFLWDNKGHVVTNYHVIVGGNPRGNLPRTVKVKLAGRAQASDADVVGVEPEKDLAVLKLRDSTSNLPRPIDVGTSNDLQVGQSVLAIGNPFGLDDTLTTGVVSALGRDVNGIGGRPIRNCIQTGKEEGETEKRVLSALHLYCCALLC